MRVLCGIVAVVVVLGAAAVAADRVEAHTVDGNASAVVAGGSPTSRADTIEGTPDADTLNGKAGHDAIDGGAGADTIDGGPGRDFIRGEGGNDTIDARDGYVDAVHCGNGRDTVMADEKDAVSETCEDVSPPPEEDRTVTLTVLLNEEGQARVDPRYPYGLIEIHLGRWLRLQPGFEFTYCRPTCSYEGPAKPPNVVTFRKAPRLGPRDVPEFKFGVLANGDCWKHQGPDHFDGSCTLEMDRDRVVWIEVWPCEIIPKSWRSGNVCAD